MVEKKLCSSFIRVMNIAFNVMNFITIVVAYFLEL